MAAAPTTTFTLNETDIEIGSVRDPSGTASSARIGLLFDSIVNDGSDRESALRAKVDSVMPEVSQGCTRFYQSRYLDLVDMNDGNAWVVASQPVEVYWGYPEGTDEDTEFSLWHFGSLHRDGTSDPYESGYDLVDIERAQADSVPVEKTPQGIKFTVPSGGFSPFVLVWETGNMAGGDDPQGAIPLPGGGSGTSSLTQTGDALSIALIVVALAASFAVALAAYRKGKRACADEQDHHSA